MSLEAKINTLQEQIQVYKTLPDASKLVNGNEIIKQIEECEASIKRYEENLEILSNLSLNEINESTLTQEEFVELVNEINLASQLIKSTSTTDLDTIMQTYGEMAMNIKKCEEYIANKQMTINTI